MWFRLALAAPFGLLAALLWFSGTVVAKLAVLVAGWAGMARLGSGASYERQTELGPA